jgi:methylated-DNA-[protein]-cysteine S-methyltransferase
MLDLFHQFVPSPCGILHIAATHDALSFLQFNPNKNINYAHKFAEQNTFNLKSDTNEIIEKTAFELNEYFANKLQKFTVTLAFYGTAFQKKVWHSLLSIPFGETRSYLQQAADLGDKLAIRAVAAANGKNPIAILVPCHRVIGSNGALTGYAGGIDNKKFLLQLEKSQMPVKNTLF